MEDRGKRNPTRWVPSRTEAYINLGVAVATMGMAVWFSGPTGYNNGARVAALIGSLCSGVYLARWAVAFERWKSAQRMAEPIRPPDPEVDILPTGHDVYNRTFDQAWDRFNLNHPDKTVNWDFIAGRWPTCVCVACDPEQYGVMTD